MAALPPGRGHARKPAKALKWFWAGLIALAVCVLAVELLFISAISEFLSDRGPFIHEFA